MSTARTGDVAVVSHAECRLRFFGLSTFDPQSVSQFGIARLRRDRSSKPPTAYSATDSSLGTGRLCGSPGRGDGEYGGTSLGFVLRTGR